MTRNGTWAAVTLTEIEEKMAEEFPALGICCVFLARARFAIGPPWRQHRHRFADWRQCAGAARFKCQRGAGSLQNRERTVPISDFFVAYRKTAIEPDEILKTIVVPRFDSQPGFGEVCQWYKVSKRVEMDISTVAACFCVDLDRLGKCSRPAWRTVEWRQCLLARARRSRRWSAKPGARRL